MTTQEAMHARVAQRIALELAELKASTVQNAASAGTVMLDQSSVGRLSRMDAMQQQAMAREMGARIALRQRALEAALARIDAGTFGRCCQCGVDIAPERLEAEPAAVFCAECVAERDAAKGTRGRA